MGSGQSGEATRRCPKVRCPVEAGVLAAKVAGELVVEHRTTVCDYLKKER